MVIRVNACSHELKRLLKGFHKEPIHIEVTMQTESPDAQLTVTFVSKKNWRQLIK